MSKEHAITTDGEVLAGSITDPGLFAVIVDRYQAAFLRKAIYILRDEDLAADAVQEAFVKIYLAAGKFKPVEGASFSSWAYRILINECFRLYQKHKKDRAATFQLDAELEAVMPDRQAVAEQEQRLDRDMVVSLVSRLPVMFRRVAELVFLEDRSLAEVAVMENISEGAVRVRLHRAKRLLKKIYVGPYTY